MKYSVAQAAKILNISKEAVYNRIRRNTLRSEKIGNRIYVFLDQNLPATNDEFKELKTKYLELLAKYEGLKIISTSFENAKISKPKWLQIEQYLKKFKKSKRKKVKKFLCKRLDSSAYIKQENGEIFIKNVKLKKLAKNHLKGSK